MKIIADDKIPFLRNVLEPFAEMIYLPFTQITKNTIKNADALIIRTRTKCDENLLSGNNIKLIATATIGYDHIDTNYCNANNISWINAPGSNSSSVKQYIAAALLYFAEKRNIKLEEVSIGIVGVGNVGSKVAEVSKILDLRTLLNDPPRERSEGKQNFISLEQLIEESKIITFHVPLSFTGQDKTFHLADKNFFNKFSEPKTIFNSSRGEVIHTNALIDAINLSKVYFSALDVWEGEPNVNQQLLNLTNIATPHIAGYSVEGKANATAHCVNEINKYFNLGLSPNWYPSKLPDPYQSKMVKIDCAGKSKQDVITKIIMHTYDILKDDGQLRKKSNNFEMLRSEYYVRREFDFYEVQLIHPNKSIEESLVNLGFKLI
ncbi:MAG: 4-phosphoerythronate dehydrogenase [Ignavibacteriaceae bacterium]|nr:4-phosphoerythronate dehydrogenase [Ignavibacteriaceae bacterium]